MSTDPTPGPPWSVDAVADVQAGVYDAQTTARLRSLIAEDPQAAAMLRALDATVDELSLLPPLVMPERYALRLDVAIAAEATARGHGRTTVVATAGFASMLAPGAATAAPAPSGLPSIDPDATTQRAVPPGAPGTRRPGPSGVVDPLSPTVRVPPPPRRVPLIPPVLPGADRLRSVPAAPTAAGPAGPQLPSGGGKETGLPDGVTSLDAHRARRRRWIGGGIAVAAAAAAIAVISTVGLGGSDKESGMASAPSMPAVSTTGATTDGILTPSAGFGELPPGSTDQLQAFVIEPGRFAEALDELEGRNQGKLSAAPALASCLAANGISGDQLLGVSDVTYRGESASAIAIAVPNDPTKATILVVGAGCGPDGAALLVRETVTR
jgi:hypothetical protein